MNKEICCIFVSVFVCLFVGSPKTPVSRLVVGRCLTVAAIIIIVVIIIIIIIIITLLSKPSRTTDMLGPSLLIHREALECVFCV